MGGSAKLRFPSAVSIGLAALLHGIGLTLLYLGYVKLLEGDPLLLIIALVTLALNAFLLHGLTYEVGKGKLRVLLVGISLKEVSINSIEKVRKTRTLLAAPAASLKRLELSIEGDGPLVLSPRKRTGFLRVLQKENPAIEFEKGLL